MPHRPPKPGFSVLINSVATGCQSAARPPRAARAARRTTPPHPLPPNRIFFIASLLPDAVQGATPLENDPPRRHGRRRRTGIAQVVGRQPLELRPRLHDVAPARR